MNAAVALVRSYLELCGYFVTLEIPVREDIAGELRDVTDVDVIAVRFPMPHDFESSLVAESSDLPRQTDILEVIIGEVKRGKARLNPGMRRAYTISSALARVGYQEDQVPDISAKIAKDPSQEVEINAAGHRCRVKIVCFAGHGSLQSKGVKTIHLSDCAKTIEDHLRHNAKSLSSVEFSDPTLSLFHLMEIVARRNGKKGK